MWSLCTGLCSESAHWVPRAHTPPPLFRTREIFRPKRKKGREDENRVVIKNNARENSRERANSLFTFDSCYKRTFLTVFVRTRPIFYACVVSVCLKWSHPWGGGLPEGEAFLRVRESLNQDSPQTSLFDALLLPQSHHKKHPRITKSCWQLPSLARKLPRLLESKPWKETRPFARRRKKWARKVKRKEKRCVCRIIF